MPRVPLVLVAERYGDREQSLVAMTYDADPADIKRALRGAAYRRGVAVTTERRDDAITGYREYDHSAEYLHLLSLPMWQELHPRLRTALAGVDPSAGTVLELGPGSGIGTETVLDTVPDAPVLAAEPSAALRAVLLARLAGRPDSDRVTVYPGGATDVPLPDRLAAVIGINMIGHLPTDARHALWQALAVRLAPGAPVVVNTQPPDTAVSVLPTPPFSATIGRLTYQGQGSAEPTGPDSVRWRMTYRTLDGATVLAEATAEYDWQVVATAGLAAELSGAGFVVSGTDGDLVVAHWPSQSA